MRVGVAREVKNREYRVALTPAGVTELVRAGHTVLVERGAGEGSSIPDADYTAVGARIVADADDVWADADLLLKVKEPVAEEYFRLRAGQTLFTYLHLAASKECTDALVTSGTTAIAYETVQTAGGALDQHRVPGADQLRDAGRRQRDPVLTVLHLSGDPDPHLSTPRSWRIGPRGCGGPHRVVGRPIGARLGGV